MAKILIVEDDNQLSGSLEDWLLSEHHLVDVVNNGNDALHRLKTANFDLVILDWNLPQLSGLEVCKQYRAKGGNTPILLLTGKGEISDKTEGLDSGADDYLTKPFHPSELSSRVKALLRRPSTLQSAELKVRDLVLEASSFQVHRGENEIRLLPKEFALLEFLMRHPDVVFSAEALIDRVWSTDSEASAETVRQYISRLRSKIELDGKPQMLVTVHGIGYKLQSK